MPDLIAQGTEPGNRWRRVLPEGKTVILGRGPGVFGADWDDRISRRHAEVCWQNDRLTVNKIEAARNPIFVEGREADSFQIIPGEHFVIGRTTFTLAEQRVDISLQAAQPVHEQAFSAQYLQQLKFRNARARIDVLGRLPEVISGARTQSELLVHLTGMLMAGIPTSDAVALVRVVDRDDANSPIDVLHWDRRMLSDVALQPSERLIRDAIGRGESVLHQWEGASDAQFTASENVDWAFCTPVMGDACRGWGIYVAGRFQSMRSDSVSGSDPTDLRDDLKFTEVAAATLRSLQELRLLQRQHAGLSQFFSPVVLDALAAQDPDVALAPRETDVTVLFCDLRGFSLESEKSADDLLGLLDRVGKALGVTTHHILMEGGVVGDFQGDAVMGFWGWPIAETGSVEGAVRAALAIRAELTHAANREGDPLAGFRMGIGIATGNAVAGKIGTVDHVKVTVFGPVVNLASRLEGMTKTLRAPILMDKPTADFVREHLGLDVARGRRLAVIRPFGMDAAVEVSELLPPEAAFPTLTNQNLEDYEAALDAFQEGDWDDAFQRLAKVPTEDRAKDFLTVLIAQHNRTAPNDWDGVIKLSSK